MREITEINSVTWINNSQTRVMARFVYADGSSEVLSVPCEDGNAHWQEILARWTEEQITEFTDNATRDAEEQQIKRIAREKEAAETRKASHLFNAKIEAFDIPDVIAAPKELKTRIRKAKTTTEVTGIVALCMLKAMERQDGQPVE